MDSMFSFKDPRLRHLNPNFKREELQVPVFESVNDVEAFRSAIDSIIQFNLNVNEFNYIHEFFYRLNDLVVEKTGGFNWAKLFTVYDKNNNNLLEKTELKEMLIDSGLKDATDCEAAFAFNVVSFF